MTKIAWIGVSFGRAQHRAFGFSAAGAVLAEERLPARVGAVEPLVGALIGGWLDRPEAVPPPVQIIVSGAPEAPGDGPEPPLRPVPCPPLDPAGARPWQSADPRLALTRLAGLSQARPLGRLCGEETLIAGFLDQTPGFDGTLCLPGGVTHWVQISAGEVVSFRSGLSGALLAALGFDSSSGAASEAFDAAVAETLSRPEALTHRLAGLRFGAAGADAERAAGLIIGHELAGARGYWLGTRLVVLGTGPAADRYAAALGAQGGAVERADAEAALLAGLRAARAAL